MSVAVGRSMGAPEQENPSPHTLGKKMKKVIVSSLFFPVLFLFGIAGCEGIETIEGESEEAEALESDAPEAETEAIYKCCIRPPSGGCRLRVEQHRQCP